MERFLKHADKVFEYLPIGILVTDNFGNIIIANKANERLLGIPKEVIIKKSIFDDWHSVDSDQNPLTSSEYPASISFHEKKVIYDYEMGINIGNGKIKWLLVTSVPVDSDHYGVIISYSDITDRKNSQEALKQSEQLFDNIFASLQSGLCIIDISQNVLLFNAFFSKIIGHDNLIGLKCLSLFSEYEKHSIQTIIEAVLLTESAKETEVCIRRNHHTYYYDLHCSPLNNNKAEMAGIILNFRDITLKREIERELSNTSENLHELEYIVSQSPMVFSLRKVSEDFPVRFISSNINQFGYTPSDFYSGRVTSLDIIHEDYKELVRANYENMIANELNSVEINYKIYQRDGSLRWINEYTFLRFDEQGEKNFIQSITYDITKIKVAEKSLLFRANFESIIAKISTLFVRLGAESIDEAINSALKIIGEFSQVDRSYLFLYSDDGKYMSNTHEWVSDGTRSEKESIQNLPVNELPWWQKQIENRREIYIPKVEDLKEDAKIEKEVLLSQKIKSLICVPLFTEERVVGFLGFDSVKKEKIWRDEDFPLLRLVGELIIFAQKHQKSEQERKKAESALLREKDELSITLKSISDGVITFDLDWNEIIANDAALTIIGQPNEKYTEISINNFAELIEEKEKSAFFDNINKLHFDNVNGINNNQTIINAKDGTRKIILYSLNKIQTITKEYQGFVFVFRDITEKVQIENQLSHSQKMESVGQLAAGIAHEINTPMQFVGNNITFLKEALENITKYISELKKSVPNDVKELEKKLEIDYLLEEIPEALEQSTIGISRVSKIVMAMKDFAHPGGGEKAFANINNCITTSSTISKNEWKYVSEIEFDLNPDIPYVFCNADEINQVLLNMIINAAHAIEEKLGKEPKEKGVITISTTSEKNYVTIQIKDTGTGIEKENINKIFEPFFTTKEVGKGTGQGLAITHNIIVKKHRGKVSVESEKNKGTTFIVKLPIKME